MGQKRNDDLMSTKITTTHDAKLQLVTEPPRRDWDSDEAHGFLVALHLEAKYARDLATFERLRRRSDEQFFSREDWCSLYIYDMIVSQERNSRR